MVSEERMLRKYHARLSSIPAPGGNGCHTDLLGVANYGVRAGLQPEQIHADLREHIPVGQRTVPDREIAAAIARALADRQDTATGPTWTTGRRDVAPRPKAILRNPAKVLQTIIAQSAIQNESDLWEASPIRISQQPEDDAILFLSTLFEPSDLIFIGDRQEPGILGKNIRPVSDVIETLKKGFNPPPLIAINPLNGIPMERKSRDGTTLRGDANVEVYRHCIGEFDNIPWVDQLRFWSAVDLPIRALVDSGGKSIHGWIDLGKLAEITSHDQWERVVRLLLYRQILVPMGIDGACSNPARLSRLPGHFRTEKHKFQRLLWISKEGRKVFE